MKQLWNWLRDGGNRGALQLVLQYLIGPFSLVGIATLIYFWMLQAPEFAFEVEANGGDTLTSSEEKITFTIKNTGNGKFFAPSEFRCYGETVVSFGAQSEFIMRANENTEINSDDIRNIDYFLLGTEVLSYHVDENTKRIMVSKSNKSIYQMFNEEHVQAITCNAAFETAKETVLLEFKFNASPSSADKFRFLGVLGYLSHRYPQ